MSQVTFIFLTQIYYKMNFTISSQTIISIKDFHSTLRTTLRRLYFIAHKKNKLLLKMFGKLVVKN